MSEILTFSQCLSRLMQRHRLTLSQLGALIGSRSSLKRVLADDANEGKRRLVFEKICQSGYFSEEDCQQLSNALQISRIGAKSYQFQKNIENLLNGHPTPSHPPIRLPNGELLAQRLSPLKEAQRADIVMVNTCFPAAVDALLPLFASRFSNVHMTHLIHGNAYTGIAFSNYLSAAFPLLFDGRYVPYELPLGSEEDVHSLGGNMLFLRVRTEAGITESTYIFPSSTLAVKLDFSNDSFTFANKLIDMLACPPNPLREPVSAPFDLTRLCMTFLSHELNRATYSVSNDLCFHQTPTLIASAALSDKGAFPPTELNQVLSRTVPIHEQRYQNHCHKKKETYQIMTIRGCKRFLETGLMTDHFYGMRPFTPKERAEIFGGMLSCATANPFFVPLLNKDPDYVYRYGIICYDKLGLSFDLADTDYDLKNGYRSTFLMCPNFSEVYRDLFVKKIVPTDCFSREESLRILTEMYHGFLREQGLGGT